MKTRSVNPDGSGTTCGPKWANVSHRNFYGTRRFRVKDPMELGSIRVEIN